MSWEAQFRMTLDGVRLGPDEVLESIEGGAEILGFVTDHTAVGLRAIASGACQEAVRLTAEYASNRKQFGKPIATFHAVGQRLADAYIDNEAVGLTMRQAATRLAEDLMHGGISIDVD